MFVTTTESITSPTVIEDGGNANNDATDIGTAPKLKRTVRDF